MLEASRLHTVTKTHSPS